LDSQHGAEIVALLRTMVTRFRQTVLLVTHSVAAADAADYIWIMRDGRLITKTSRSAVPVGA
jgi:putative ABC transport system ATP-binding protein/macrolide transport system ATP-binding/permease protein